MSGRRQGRRSLLTYYPQHYRLPGPERITTRIMTCFYDPGDSNIGLVLVTLELTFNARFFSRGRTSFPREMHHAYA
jgi:hypothetical protein